MQHHAFLIEAEVETGVERALTWVREELGLESQGNPDVIVLRHGLFSVEDARKVVELAGQAPVAGESKAIVIAARRAYHESQNALLKLFEEPTAGTYLFLTLPSLGGVLPTLRSRVELLKLDQKGSKKQLPREAEEFIKASADKRTAIIKKLSTGRDEDERREHREHAIAIVSAIEKLASHDLVRHRALLNDTMTLRGFLHERSAPVKMILEHLSIVLPKDFAKSLLQ